MSAAFLSQSILQLGCLDFDPASTTTRHDFAFIIEFAFPPSLDRLFLTRDLYRPIRSYE